LCKKFTISSGPGEQAEAALQRRASEVGLDIMEVLAGQADETLVRAIQKGILRKCAFEELFRRYMEPHNGEAPFLTRMLLRRGATIHDCFDVCQNVFLRCYQTCFGTFDPNKGSVSRYLYSWALNDWRSAQRKKRPELAAELEQVDSRRPVLEGMVLRENVEQVNAAIATLPWEERVVIELQRDEALTPAEVAARLQVPVQHVYRRRHSARIKLAQALGWQHPADVEHM
jgi:RNA polymerase sigma factor (sigma-70 family)